jgi:hypothetical protein
MVSCAAMGMMTSPSGAGSIVYVDDDAPAGGDGASWATAFRFLQDGLAVAGSADEVRVGTGVYRPDQSAGNPEGTLDQTVSLSPTGAVVGGYAGLAGSNPDEYDPVSHPTILNGDLLGNDGAEVSSRSDNSWHVVRVTGRRGLLLQGLTIQGGGRVPVGGLPQSIDYRGGGVLLEESSISVLDCTFTKNWSQRGSGIYGTTSTSVSLQNVLFLGNKSVSVGGGMQIYNGDDISAHNCKFVENTASAGAGLSGYHVNSLSLTDCLFQNNSSSGPGTAVHTSEVIDFISLKRCTFSGNTGLSGGGALAVAHSTTVQECLFENNSVTTGGGGLFEVTQTGARIQNCTFHENDGGSHHGGGVLMTGANALIANCSFSNNLAEIGGGVAAGDPGSIVACSFYGNQGCGCQEEDGAMSNWEISNSVFWNNSPLQVANLQSDPEEFILTSCDIQGGWSGPGSNNFSADPLFVQPGSGDLRLGFGSPCLDAGNNSLLPADALDLDSDGNVTEPLPLDLAGAFRIQNSIVDIGAYEGAFEQLPPQDSAEDVDEGEKVTLIPEGGEWNPPEQASMKVENTGGGEDAAIEITELEIPVYPEAGDFQEIAAVLVTETTFEPGEAFLRVYIPFDAAALAGLEPDAMDLISLDLSAGDWSLAVERNTKPSPGHSGPVGDRIVKINNEDSWGLSLQLGDYGIYWNPDLASGFAWANVDVAASFAVGAPICFGDGASPSDPHAPDANVDDADLTALLESWGAEPLPGGDSAGGAFTQGLFDLNDDAAIDGADLGLLLASWGECASDGSGGVAGSASDPSAEPIPPSPSPAASPSPAGDAGGRDSADPVGWVAVPPGRKDARDLDRDGMINGRDLGLLLADWGAVNEEGSARGNMVRAARADLNRDGIVDEKDLSILLGRPVKPHVVR